MLIRENKNTPSWMKKVLFLAGIYNIFWGAITIFFPIQTLAFLGIGDLNYPQIWQCLGMIVGVYGLGYFIAARNPVAHWPIIFVGFLGKLLGPVGFLWSAFTGSLPWRFGLLNVTNDLVWLFPFALILLYSRKRAADFLY